MPAKQTTFAASVVLALLALATFVVVFQVPSASQTPLPKDARIPQGKIVYAVQQDENAKPRITTVSVDPPDVRVGHVQTLSITIESESGDNEVTTETKTDNKTVTLELDLVKTEGNLKTYEASWEVEDTHDATYYTKFIVRDQEGNRNEITIAWTDPCGIQNGGDWTMTTNCTISAQDGVDNGNITIQNGTLTLNAPFIFNPGKVLTLAGGSILFGSGASLVKDTIWQIDNDADGLPANSTMYRDGEGPKGDSLVRRYTLASSTIDCFDTNASIPDTSGTYFMVHRGDGSFDYNCDGVEEKGGGTHSSSRCSQFGFCEDQGDVSGEDFACGEELRVDNCYFDGLNCYEEPVATYPNGCR